MRKAVFVLAISALACAASAQPVAPPAPVPEVSGVTVEGKSSGLPKGPCKEKDKACIQQVVAALHALTGVEKQKFEIWCMANITAQMRRSTYYSGDRTDSSGGSVGADRSFGDSNAAVETACSNIPKDKKAKG
jgi:hypothetical protein